MWEAGLQVVEELVHRNGLVTLDEGRRWIKALAGTTGASNNNLIACRGTVWV